MVDNTDNNLQTDFVRLSPWAILHFAASSVLKLTGNAYALVPVVYGLYQTDSALITISAIFGMFALIVISAILRYFYFSYLIHNETVQIREGVLSKKHLNLPFHRIQNVNFEHPFYFRPLGLVTVKIDGAGSSSEEVRLAALALEPAVQIREEIHRHNLEHPDIPSNVDESGQASSVHSWKLMLTRSLPDLVIHGLTNNRAWIIIGAVGAVYGQVADDFNTYIAGLGLDVGGFLSNQGTIAIVALGFSALMLTVMIVAALSVLGSIFSYYNFELHMSDEAFKVRRGLLTHHEINMKKSRIQAVRVRRDWLDMILGRMNVVFEQISHGQTQPGDMGSDKRILIPSVENFHTDQLNHEALAAEQLERLEFTSISPRYFIKLVAITMTCYIALALTISMTTPWIMIWALALPPVMAIHIFLLRMSCKRWGLAVDAGVIVVRKGIFGVDHILIPAFKIQRIGRKRTPLMQRNGLSSISIAVASSHVSVPFLPDRIVRDAIDYSLYETESTNRSWM